MYHLKRIKKNVFFDFETTYDDNILSQRYINKGVAQYEGLKSFEQIDFAISIVVDVNIPFKKICCALLNDIKHVYNKELDSFIVPDNKGNSIDLSIIQNFINEHIQDLIIKKEISSWSIPAAKILFDVLAEIDSIINK